MQEIIDKLTKEKNQAYWERNQLVAALSKIFPSYLVKHDENDKMWEKDWRTIVYIIIPGSKNITQEELQVSWHIHDSEIPMFDHLKYERCEWDGHDTEEKYRRLRKL